jgi:hypothetical protein
MRLLRRIAAGLALLTGLALGAAWLLPQWLDWDRHRATLSAIAS